MSSSSSLVMFAPAFSAQVAILRTQLQELRLKAVEVKRARVAVHGPQRLLPSAHRSPAAWPPTRVQAPRERALPWGAIRGVEAPASAATLRRRVRTKAPAATTPSPCLPCAAHRAPPSRLRTLALHQLLPRSFRSRGGALRLLGIAGRGLGVLLVLLALRLSGRELRLQRCHLRLKGKLLLGRQRAGRSSLPPDDLLHEPPRPGSAGRARRRRRRGGAAPGERPRRAPRSDRARGARGRLRALRLQCSRLGDGPTAPGLSTAEGTRGPWACVAVIAGAGFAERAVCFGDEHAVQRGRSTRHACAQVPASQVARGPPAALARGRAQRSFATNRRPRHRASEAVGTASEAARTAIRGAGSPARRGSARSRKRDRL